MDPKKWSTQYRAEIQSRIVEKSQETESGCMIWQASVDNYGYPQIGGVFGKKRWMTKTHALVWKLVFGPVPAKRRVSHKCGERRCVNPVHLVLTTTKDQTVAAINAQPRPTRETDRERFMEYVTKSSLGCWLWQGSRIGAAGYGTFWMDQKQVFAHRASHILFKGPIPKGFVVMHSCDDRQCVNPEHLTAGTQKENMEDRSRKNRHAHGERAGNVTTTEEQVRAMRGEYIERDGEMTRLANKYGVSLNVVSDVINGVSWRHVKIELGSAPSTDAPYKRANGESISTAKMTWEKVRALRAEHAAGAKVARLAEKYGLKLPQTYAIIRGKAWVESTPVKRPYSTPVVRSLPLEGPKLPIAPSA